MRSARQQLDYLETIKSTVDDELQFVKKHWCDATVVLRVGLHSITMLCKSISCCDTSVLITYISSETHLVALF